MIYRFTYLSLHNYVGFEKQYDVRHNFNMVHM